MDDELIHATAYDAAKRRAYYLRTRKLKGRTSSVKVVRPKKTRAQRQAERRKKQEAQIAALKGRLEQLRDALAAEVKKAQARSGVDTAKAKKSSATSPSSQQSSSKTEKLTAAQKKEKAKEDKKRREAENTPEAQIKSLNEKIKTIQERIIKMRKDGSVGARRNSSK